MGFSLAVPRWQALVHPVGYGPWLQGLGLGALVTIDMSDLRSVFLGFYLVVSSRGQKPRACHSASQCHRWHRVFGAPIVWLHMSQYRTRIRVDVYLLWVSLQVKSNVRKGTSCGWTGFVCQHVRKWGGFSASTQSLLWPTSGLLILSNWVYGRSVALGCQYLIFQTHPPAIQPRPDC